MRHRTVISSLRKLSIGSFDNANKSEEDGENIWLMFMSILKLCLDRNDLMRPISSLRAIRHNLCRIAVLMMQLVIRHDHHSEGVKNGDV